MKTILKVRRSGIGVGDPKKKTAFRQWLNEQPRKDLTFDKDVEEKDGLGWNVPEFVLEAHKRGIGHRLRWGTVLGWARGNKPRELWLYEIREVFPKIRF